MLYNIFINGVNKIFLVDLGPYTSDFVTAFSNDVIAWSNERQSIFELLFFMMAMLKVGFTQK